MALVDKTASARMPLEFRRTEPGSEGEPPGEEPEPLSLGTRVGRYLVERRVAKGGMGIVYVAHDPELDRRVALKWVHRELSQQAGGDDAQNRLLREARAMARLAHPNVVTVYDLLVHGGHLVLAMELVDGETLGAWLDREPKPSWRKMLPLFVQAGRGLAAAHAVGLVHRDFKPANVLLSADGRARVTDFGLARTADVEREPAQASETSAGETIVAKKESGTEVRGEPRPAAGDATTGADPFATPLTRTGAIMGTPAYMAPEQYRGEADARSDQYAFCAALYEALSGTLPFDGETWDELRKAVAEGEAKPLPAKAAPPWLTRVIRRGLRVDPAQRFPSMDALLEVLERDPALRRRRWMVAGAVLAAAAAVGGVVHRDARVRALQVCRGADAQLAGVWDGPRKAAVRAAFGASTKPYAADALRGAERALDGYAAAWAAMHTEACEATQVRRDQSPELMDLRMACLAERRAELRATVTLFEHPDDALIARAVSAANGLGALDRCADSLVLRALAAPAHLRDGVEALRTELAQAKSARYAGRYAEALTALRGVRDRAHALGYAPFEAEVLTDLGDVERLNGNPVAAEATLYSAAWMADAAGDDLHRAWAWTEQLYNVGYALKKRDAVPMLREQAVAAAKRVPGDPDLHGALESALGAVLLDDGKPAEARAAFERELAIHERAHGKDCPHAYLALANIALSYAHEHNYPRALEVQARTVDLMERTVGSAHPDLAAVLAQVGSTRDGLEEFTAAEAIFRRALSIVESAFGPENPALSIHLGNLARALSNQGRFAEAVPLAERALVLREKALGKTAPKLIFPLLALGQACAGLGDAPRAIAALDRALGLPAGGNIGLTRSEVKYRLATALRAAGREPARAMDLAREARDEIRKSEGGDPHDQRVLAELEAFLARPRR